MVSMAGTYQFSLCPLSRLSRVVVHKPFTVFENRVRHNTATIAHIQLILGVWLYLISPITTFFIHHFADAVHIREIRFFGIEHSSTMLIAVLLITVGSALAKRKKSDRDKFKTIAIWFTIALLLILAAIPWEFSPLVSRPYLRGFSPLHSNYFSFF